MKPAWVAGVTRTRLLLSRTIGARHARAIAGCRSLDEGIAALEGSAYGERIHAGEDLAAAERALAETLLWHLRLAAGWLPAAGASLVRMLARWFEIQNIDARLAALASDGREPRPLALGGLATAWPAIAQSRTIEEMVAALDGSAWGRVAGRSAAELAIALRVAWARGVQETAPCAAYWVSGAAALLIARELLLADSREHLDQLGRLPAIGVEALGARSVGDLRSALPARAAWALAEVNRPTDLWRAELGWWDRVERDAGVLLRSGDDEEVVIGGVALLAFDARRTMRALEAAAHGEDTELVGMIGGAT